MRRCFIDIDGVIRNLDEAVLGCPAEAWCLELDGLHFIDYVTKNRERLLKDTPECEYAEPLRLWIREMGTAGLCFLSCQPEEWRPYTEQWLKARFPEVPVVFTKRPEEKLIILESQDGILVDDYPLYDDYSRLAVVDRPYNQDIDAKVRIRGSLEFVMLLAKCRLGR